MDPELPLIAYPALVWREGYIYLAKTSLELCAHPRSIFPETVRRSKSGELHLVDAEGRLFDIVDWKSIKPFGGVNGIALRLLRSVFAAPVLANETKLSLPEFKKTLARAIRGRYRHDTDRVPGVMAIEGLQAADSYSSAMAAIPRR